jgi:hypothetical protein
MLVLMALATTFAAGPALNLLDPRRELSEPPEETLRRTGAAAAVDVGRVIPERSILVAPSDDRSIDSLLRLAEPLALSQPPRELLLVRLLPPASLSTGLVSEDRQLQQTTVELDQQRQLLGDRGVPMRTAAFTSPEPGADLVRLASAETVDLVLLNGRRPLLGEGIPGGEVGTVLQQAPCDVALLVERDRIPEIDAQHPVVVPFGGGEHDWAALELAAWIAHSTDGRIVLLGAAAAGDAERDASRLLANASLVLQQLAGIAAESQLVTPGRDVIQAAAGAGLLVVGLSERWRQEGLDPLRAEIARRAPAPTLFVRRGERPGALAPPQDMTRFRWSTVDAAGGGR